MTTQTGNVGGRLLVVDDEVRQMEALCSTLSAQGFVTLGCTDAHSAMYELKSKSFDLLLADLMMPEMDGIGLLRSALQIDPTLVVIIMTGQGTISSAVQAMQSGAIDYILKPFRLSEILPVLNRAMTVRQLRLENTLLERRVQERSLALEVANRELDAFTRSVSHDLRTPLSGVIGVADLLEYQFGDQLPATAMQLVNQIRKSSGHMLSLIDGLMRLSQSGRQALNIELVDLSELVIDVCASLQSDVDQPSPPPLCMGSLEPVYADPLLLRQVYANLLSNAYKFSGRNPHPEVEIGCLAVAHECIYFVKDNGAGFDMSKASKLFGAFERLHSHDEFAGTGVGLTIVERIVARHGGRVWVEAQPGVGACFYFTLSAPDRGVA